MTDKEIQSFNTVFEFFKEWREPVVKLYRAEPSEETEAQWKAYSDAVGRMGTELDIDNNPLGWHLMEAAIETIDDYCKGRIPIPLVKNNYFGRDDI